MKYTSLIFNYIFPLLRYVGTTIDRGNKGKNENWLGLFTFKDYKQTPLALPHGIVHLTIFVLYCNIIYIIAFVLGGLIAMPGNHEEIKQEIQYADGNNFTIELLKGVKIQSKRWMIAFFAILIAWFLTIAVFIFYLYQYDTISYSQDGSGYNNINTGEQGDVNNGTDIPGESEEEW